MSLIGFLPVGFTAPYPYGGRGMPLGPVASGRRRHRGRHSGELAEHGRHLPGKLAGEVADRSDRGGQPLPGARMDVAAPHGRLGRVRTAREQAGKMGYGYDYGRLTTDSAYNVMLGSAYFARLLNQWDGNVPLAVASYNAGAGNVRKWVNAYGDPRNGTDVLRWIERIPFSETKAYVQRVIENSVVYDRMNPSSPNGTVHVSRYLGKSRPG